MLFTGVIWQVPHNPNALHIQDNKHFVYHASYSFRMASSNVTNITDIMFDFQSGRMSCT